MKVDQVIGYSATRELSVYLDGQRLRHECHPTYLGVTLDCTLSYRVHLTKTAGKLKNRNNLLMKLAGSTWGASANTLRSSALALCYPAAEYCATVWSRCAHTSQVDVQLNSAMRLISGFQCSPTLNRHCKSAQEVNSHLVCALSTSLGIGHNITFNRK